MFVDNEVGGAVATGTGELVMKTLGTFLIVELMRNGRTPQEACVEEHTIENGTDETSAVVRSQVSDFMKGCVQVSLAEETDLVSMKHDVEMIFLPVEELG